LALGSRAGGGRHSGGWRSIRTKPFGELNNSPTDSNPFQFTGRENDGAGFRDYRSRCYVPAWGRFLSEDPVGLNAGINLFGGWGDAVATSHGRATLNACLASVIK
jgi:RHS repeat-associated protein